MDYILKRSNRKTIGIEVTPEGVLVCAPKRATAAEIERLLRKHRRWIEKRQEALAADLETAREEGLLSEEDLQALARRAKQYIPERVAVYAPLVGASPGRITIRTQKSRWGSCSSKGNLNFNCLLMLTPPEVQDSIVVHELCHRLEPNHSDRFYAHVLRVFPNYWECHRWLKENEAAILRRMTG